MTIAEIGAQALRGIPSSAYFDAAKAILNTVKWNSSVQPQMSYGRRGRGHKLGGGGRKMRGRKRNYKKRQGGSNMVTKYHEKAQTYRKKKFGGRKKRSYHFRKRVIKAIADDAPAKQFVMNPVGGTGSNITASAMAVASGKQVMTVIGSLHTWAGNENANDHASRDMYEIHATLAQANAQAYVNSLGGVSGYADIYDCKSRVEGGYSEVILNNPSGGATVIVDLYECVCRRDKYGQAILSDLLDASQFAGQVSSSVFQDQGGPASVTSTDSLGVTPFQMDGFVHQWKIVKVSRVRLEAGSSVTYTMTNRSMKTIHGEQFRGLISGTNDEVGKQIAKRGLTKILVARAFGEPTATGTGAATIYYNNVRRYTGRVLNNQAEELTKLVNP